MISTSERKSLLERKPMFKDLLFGLQVAPNVPKGAIKEAQEDLAYVRKFNDEVVRPYSLKTDRMRQEDPEMLPIELMNAANKWGFYTMYFPKAIGGHGRNFLGAGLCFEEMTSACAGIANVAAVHYLGVACLGLSGNVRLIHKILSDVVKGEKEGKPCLLSTAITEPEAGTDVEEVELVDKGRITCFAEKVKGGYVVNGRKIFISMGHVSTWHMLIAYSDLKKPSENVVALAVKTDTKGFSFGRQENKMGQKACPASELIFEDCFIPDDMVIVEPSMFKGFKNPMKDIHSRYLDYVLAASRAGVGAFGTGVARGAYEEALSFASEAEVEGKLLINHEWAQVMLSDMYKNVCLGRMAYTEGFNANGLYSLLKMMQSKPLFYFMKYMPGFIQKIFTVPFMGTPFIADMLSKYARKALFETKLIKDDDLERAAGWGSLSKFVGTDFGMQNCHLGLELMGQAGVRHDGRAEKHFRDAKLFQIYEGTNQLNRINMFKCLIGNSIPEAKTFEH